MRPNPQETADLFTFTEEILNETSLRILKKPHFLYSDYLRVVKNTMKTFL